MRLIQEYQNKINLFLKELMASLKEKENLEPQLLVALNYIIEQGGQRLRSAFLLYLSDLLSVDSNESIIAAVALELIHNYSLVHDDLPGMDNDSIRRGQPTCHVKFGEGIAILTGTGLLTLGLQLLVDGLTNNHQSKILQLVLEAIGINGLLSGQVLDLSCQKTPIKDPVSLIHLYYLKTGKLFELAFTIPALLASLPKEKEELLSEIGGLLGILYQLFDDLKDKDLPLETSLLQTVMNSLLDSYNKSIIEVKLVTKEEINMLLPIEKLLSSVSFFNQPGNPNQP